MADDIASLGLDTKEYEASIGRAVKSLDRFFPAADKATEKVEKVSAAFRIGARFGSALSSAIGGIGKALLHGFGAGSAIELTNRMFDGYEAAKKLNEEIDKIGIDRGNPEFRTLDYFEKRIDTITEKVASLQKAAGFFATAGEIIGEQFKALTSGGGGNVGSLSDRAREIAARKDAQVDALLSEKKKAEESREAKVEQIKVNKREYQAQEDEKAFNESIRRENEAFDNQKDKEASARAEQNEKDTADFNESISDENKAFDEQKEAKKKAQNELAHQQENDFNKQIQDENKAFDEQKEKRLAGLREIAKENEKIAAQLAIQSEQMRLQSEGRGSDADLLGVQSSYAERIKEQNQRGNTEGAKELKRQQAIEEQRIMAELARETPGQKRDARREGASMERDARNQEARDDENEKRFSKGQRSRDINESIERRANRARENIDVQQDKQADKQSGYTADDSKNLAAIAKAFEERDK